MNQAKRTAVLVGLALAFTLLPAADAEEAASKTLLPIEVTGSVLGAGTSAPAQKNEALTEQIASTYTAAKKASKVKSFKGKCGKYVNRQLVLLGINTSYIGCNGNKAYDIYAAKSQSSGGYSIRAYGTKAYTLEAALKAIEAEDAHARNILVGFQKGTSSAGKKYGHVLFIHGIENGEVYFSDSYAQTVDEVRYAEGEPIVCSIERFAELYKKYKLDGVIWFA